MKNDELIKAQKQFDKRGKRPDVSERTAVHLEPGDATKFMSNALEIAALPPIDTNNAGEVGRRLQEYFEIVLRNDCKPNYPGMALALGMDRHSMWMIASGQTTKSQDVISCIKKATSVLDMLMNEYMTNGKINPVSGIFLMKNHLNYRDQSEIVVTPNNPLGETQDRAALEAKYAESIIVEAETP